MVSLLWIFKNPPFSPSKLGKAVRMLIGFAKQKESAVLRPLNIFTCTSLRPLESESDVSLYAELVISTSVEARLLFFRGLQESEISLAP